MNLRHRRTGKFVSTCSAGGKLKSKRLLALSAAALAGLNLIGGRSARAINVSDTWNGGGADNNWLTVANWGGAAPNTADLPPDLLIFAGTTRLTNNNNFTIGSSFSNISFSSGAGAFSLSGNGITLGTVVTNNSSAIGDNSAGVTQGGGVTNGSATAVTDGLSMTLLAGTHQISTTSSGQLNLSGGFTRNTGGMVLFSNGGGNINVTGSGLALDGSANGGILGGWAVIGLGNSTGDWATLSGGNVVAYAGYTTIASGAITSSTGTNLKFTTTNGNLTTGGGTTDINTLLFSDTTTARSVSISGTLRLGALGGIMNATGSTGSAHKGLTITGGTLTAGGTSGGAGELSLINNIVTGTNNDITVASVIADNTSGAVSLDTLGYVVASASNTYTGGTTIGQGRVTASNVNSFGTGTVTVTPGGQAFLNATAGSTITNSFVISGVGTLEQGGIGAFRFSNTNTLSGAITLAGTSQIGMGNGTGFITGPISGQGGLIVGGATGSSLGAGTLQLGGQLTYQGDTLIDNVGTHNSSTLFIISGKNNIMPNGANAGIVILDAQSATAAATWNLDDTNQVINGLSTTATSPANNLVQTGIVATLTIGTAGKNPSSTFGGVISGPITIIKAGSGTQTFSGTNTYSGTTAVNAGTLSVTGSTAALSAVTVNSGGTLGGSGTVNGSVSVANGGILTGGVLGTGTLTLAGAVGIGVSNGDAATFNLTANTGGSSATNSISSTLNNGLTFNGGTNSVTVAITGSGLTAGVYNLLGYTGSLGGSGFAAFPTGTLPAADLPPRIVGNLQNSTGEIQLNVTAVDFPIWRGTQNTAWITSALVVTGQPDNWVLHSNTSTTTDFVAGDNVLFDDTATGTTVDISNGNVQPGSVIFNNATKNYTVTGSNGIAGATGLTMNGTGTVVLANNNSYGGGTTINAGKLQLGNNSSAGTITGNITDSGALAFNHTDNLSFSGVISGSGAVAQNGAATETLTLSGLNTFTGALNINTGTLTTGVATNTTTGASALGMITGSPGAVNIASGAALNLGSVAANSLNFGSRQFNVQGTGVGGTGAIVNTTNNQQNAFELVTLTGNATFNATGRFDFRNNNPQLNLGGHTLTKIGTGQLTLVGPTVSGGGSIVVQGGTLGIEAGVSLLAANVSSVSFSDGTVDEFFQTGANVTAPFTFGSGGAAGSGVTMLQNNNQAVSIGSNITLQDNVILSTAGADTGNFTLTGNITDDGNSRTVTRSGGAATQAWILAGNNSYTGATNLNSGTLQLGNTNAAQNSTVTVNGGALGFSPLITNFTVAGLAGTGGIALTDTNATAVSLSVGNGGASSSYSGVLSGSGSLTKIGTGTLALNTNSTFTGGATVNLGTLLINNGGGGTPLGSGNTTVNAGGTLTAGDQDAFGFTGGSSPATININGGKVTDLGSASYRVTLPDINFTGGTLTSTAGNNGDAGGNYSLLAGTVETNATTSTAVISAGAVSLENGPVTFTVAGGNVTGGATPGVDLLISSTIENYFATTGSLVKAGSGVMQVSGINTYTGGTTINNGTLLVTGSLLTSGSVAVSGGTLAGITTGGHGVGNVNLSTGTISPGTSATPIGTLNLTSLNVSGGTLAYSLASSNASDLLAVSGAASFNASSTIAFSAAVLGSFVLLTSSSLSGTAPTISGPMGFAYTELFNSPSAPNDIILEVSPTGPTNLVWDGQSDQTTWDITSTPNWNNGVNPASVYSDGSNVVFDDTASTAATLISLNTTVSPGSVAVNSTNNNYTIAGTGSISGSGSLTMSGGSTLTLATDNSYNGGTTINSGTVQVGFGGTTGSLGTGNVTNNGSLVFNHGDAGFTVANNISGSGTVTQSGTGTTTLTGSNTYTGTTTIFSGTLAIGASGALPSGGNVANNAILAVNANATAGNVSGTGMTIVASNASFTTADFNQSGGLLNNGNITITGNGTIGPVAGTGNLTIGTVAGPANTIALAQNTGVSEQNGLTILGGGALDLNNNHLFITYGTNADPVTSIRSYLTSGYNGGGWNGAGLVSSAAHNANTAGTLKYALGYADGADGIVAGLPAGEIEVKYTLVGDLDLNGVVNGTDFSKLSTDFGHVERAWDLGDLDYNNVVNGSDFSAMSANFGRSASGSAVALSPADWAAFDSFAIDHGLISVPEPTAIGMLAVGGMGLLARRRRKNQLRDLR